MNVLKCILIVMICCFTLQSNSQIRFSEIIQESKIATDKEASLFFIEFWATWCKPCVYASEYLSVLQRQFPNDFFVVSLSEEQPEIIKRFLKKHQTDLAIAIDYKGETFAKENSRTLPHGILINTNGTVVWRGSPTDFKRADLEYYLRQNSRSKPLHKVIKIQAVKEEVFKEDYIPKKGFEIKPLKIKNFETLEVNSIGDYWHYKGSLKSIIAREKQILEDQIVVDEELNKVYEVYFKKGDTVLLSILDKLKLDIYHSNTKGEVLRVDASNVMYWDTNQIDWGENTANFLIDDSQIQADNVTSTSVFYELSKVLNLPLVLEGESDSQLHDWIIHHRFYDLMVSGLEDTYGIKLGKENGTYKKYTIRKKTP